MIFMEPADSTPLIRAVRRLTISVWVLTGVMSLILALVLAGMVMSSKVSIPEGRASIQSASIEKPERDAKVVQDDVFSQPGPIAFDKQIAAASVIAVGRYESDGERRKCVISEILKVEKDVVFTFKVGDEYSGCSYFPKAGESRGDGVVIFFTGKYPQMRVSSGLYDGRLAGLGNMPLELLRKQLNGERQDSKK